MKSLRFPVPVTKELLIHFALLLLGLLGFYQFYWGRFLVFVATGLALVGLWAVLVRRWEMTIPIQLFFLGTWSYNFFDGVGDRSLQIVGVMLAFLFLLAYGFWMLLERPTLKALTLLHSLYLTLATLVVWELALLIKLFWPVEPWSRTFVVVAAFIFLRMAIHLRLGGETSTRPLVAPLVIILFLISVVIYSTPIPLS